MSEKRQPLTSLGLNRHVVTKNEEPVAIATPKPPKERGSFKFLQTRINVPGWLELSRLSLELDRPLQWKRPGQLVADQAARNLD